MPPDVDLEDIIRELSMISDGSVKFWADMWWGIRVEGELWPPEDEIPDEATRGTEYATYVECDRIRYGLMASYRHWSEKYEEVSKRPWKPYWVKV
jgi:hypothetical protein